jgi:hypothetical protein
MLNIYFNLEGQSKTKRTEIWVIRKTADKSEVGRITYDSHMRQYVFNPSASDMVLTFEEIWEISKFMYNLSESHKRGYTHNWFGEEYGKFSNY